MRGKRPDSEETGKILKDLEGKLLVVEGMNDEKALNTLGLNNIIKINRKPLHQVALEIDRILSQNAGPGAREIVMLTDFDREGRRLAARLARLLGPYKIRINRRLRRKVMEFGKPEIQDLRNLKEDDSHVKVSASFNKICHKGKDKGERCSGKT